MITLIPAQQTIYDGWKNANSRGCIEMPTGSGKTYIGLKALEENINKKILIVVPSRPLAQQWSIKIQKLFNITPKLIMSGGNKVESNVHIAVVNSIRWKDLNYDLVILDEVHRYGSMCNFSFIPKSTFPMILGLSATVERDDGLEKDIFPYAPLICCMSHEEARANKLLAPYTIENVAVRPTVDEDDILKNEDEVIKKDMHKYGSFPILTCASRQGDPVAKRILQAIQKRIDIYATTLSKQVVVEKMLTERFNKEKVIVFAERIEVVEKLVKEGRFLYTSTMKADERQKTLDSFNATPNGILLCVRALDEGLNVPEASVAILISSSGTRRQQLQRLGRVLRYVEGKQSLIVQLYLYGTKESTNIRKRTREIKEGADEIKWVVY